MPGDDTSKPSKAPPIWRGPASLVPKAAEPPPDEPVEPDETEKASTLLYDPLPGQKPMTAAELKALYEDDDFAPRDETDVGEREEDPDDDDGGFALVEE